jgi:hypothetical protein
VLLTDVLLAEVQAAVGAETSADAAVLAVNAGHERLGMCHRSELAS